MRYQNIRKIYQDTINQYSNQLFLYICLRNPQEIMIKVDQLKGLQIRGLRLVREIDRGSFGVVYEAISVKSDKKYAVKVQPNTTKNPQLYFQFDIYYYINRFLMEKQKFQHQNQCFPSIHAIFSDTHYTFLVMELLGKSLYQFFKDENLNINRKLVYFYATKMLITFHFLHFVNIVYRDIKPQNFLLRLDQPYSLVLVDFGLCKKEAEKKQRQKHHHTNRTLIGTARYASINSHEGKQVTKADDIESLVYLLIYLLKGRLPWQGIKKKTQNEKNSQILRIKKTISVGQLCQGLPQGIHVMVSYIRNLQKGETVDYQLLITCIKNASNQSQGLGKEIKQQVQELAKKVEPVKKVEEKSSTPVRKSNELSAQKSSQGSSMNASQSMKRTKKSTKRPIIKRQFLIKEDPNDSISQPSDSDPDQHPSKFAIQ